VEDPAGAHLADEMLATAGLKRAGPPSMCRKPPRMAAGPRLRALVSDLGGGVLLAVGGDLRQIGDLEEAIVLIRQRNMCSRANA
jgi:hypothetical protein